MRRSSFEWRSPRAQAHVPVSAFHYRGVGSVTSLFGLILAFGFSDMWLLPAVARAEPSDAGPASARVLTADEVVRQYAGAAGPIEGKETVTFAERNGRVSFSDGRNHYALDAVASRVVNVDANPSRYLVTYACDWCCESSKPRTIEVTRPAVAARRINTQAFSLYREGKFLEAAAGFAAAVKLDGKLEMARTNLASSLARAGHLDEAAAVLCDDDGTIPLGRHLTLSTDTDLQVLASHPRIRAQLAPQPGNAVVTLKNGAFKGFPVAVSDARGLVAILSRYESWGSEHFAIDLEIFSKQDGARLLRAAIVGKDDVDGEGHVSKTVPAKLRAATSFLQRLGFRTLEPNAFLRGQPQGPGPNRNRHFPTLGVVVSNDTSVLRAFRRGKLVGRYRSPQALGYLVDALYVPDSKLLVVRSHHDEPEGCGVDYDIAVGAVAPMDLSLTSARPRP
jgi:hypothetical protein